MHVESGQADIPAHFEGSDAVNYVFRARLIVRSDIEGIKRRDATRAAERRKSCTTKRKQLSSINYVCTHDDFVRTR